ncbi:hypothetical protein ACODT3_22600 [Streptomyces sp. 4.24]|uniref:hypothetical protein n=1 Tax=Streptomyces tritrimontium TaxID=3406573 RepID=UPI003BB50427
MHGPGTPPPHGHQPSNGGVVALRVLFALLPILSCGLLAWGSMLRLALVTRKPRDWWLLGVSAAASVIWMVLSGLDPTTDNSGWQANAGGLGTIVTGLSVAVYFLVADIRHHEARNARAAGGWYPQPASPYGAPLPQGHETRPSYGYPPAVPRQAPQQLPQQPPRRAPEPAPAPTQPPRIGQVRAELDELSELLRKQPPHHDGPHHEGPRP